MNSPNYKELFRETGCLSAEMLMRYRDGKLSQDEKHAAEHHLTGCELCSDALEGLTLSKSETALSDINESIRKRYAAGNPVSAKPYFAIAASLTALALLSWFAWNQFNSISDERLAVSQTAEEQSLPVIAETPAAVVTPEKEVVSSVPKYEPKPIADPNGQRSISAISTEPAISEMQEAPQLQESELAVTESKDAADDRFSAVSKNEVAMFQAPASQDAATSGTTAGATNFTFSQNNVTYIDNQKVIIYDNTVKATSSASDISTLSKQPVRSNSKKVKPAGAAEEPLNRNNSNEYGNSITGPLMLFNQGKYDAAIRGFDKLLQQNPADQNARYYKAMSYYHLGKYETAIKILEPLAADTNSLFMEESMFYLAESYANTGQKVPAFNLYNNIIKNNSYNNIKAREQIKNLR